MNLLFMRHVLLALFLSLLSIPAAGQQWGGDVWQDIYDGLSDYDDFDEDGWAAAYDILTTLAQTPQNINETTLDDLRQIPLLSERQALAILRYRSLYGPLRAMSELTLVTALDAPRRQLLSALFFAAPPARKPDFWAERFMTDSLPFTLPDSLTTFRRRQSSPRHSVLFTVGIPTYRRQGQRDGTYLGPPLSHTLRYRYDTTPLQVAITAAQDAGEPFFTHGNGKGWDFYTGFVRLRNRGVLRNLVVGHYQMSLGLGLVLNNDYRLSRTSLLLTAPKGTTVLRGHSSRQEGNYLQGAAATITLPIGRNGRRSLNLTPFFSYRALDATPASDAPGAVATLLTSGYHRTASEIARRNATRQLAAGASVEYTALPIRVAVNVVYTALRDSLTPDRRQIYRRYYPGGKEFLAASLAYSYIGSRLSATGETAITKAARAAASESAAPALATANSLRYRFSHDWSVFALQRFYGYRYATLLGKSFGDISQVRNESGLYIGSTVTALPHLTLSAYADMAYHTWPRYGYKGASRSWDSYFLATYTRAAVTATLRYRYREQALSDGSALPAFSSSIAGTAQHTLRLLLKHARERWTWQAQAQGTLLPTSSDWGWLAAAALGHKARRLTLWASATGFRTSDYAARLYLADRALTYGSMSAMVYGSGLRLNAVAEARLTRHIGAGVRCSVLHFFDRDAISSGPQQILSATQTDIQAQLQIKL